MDERIDDFEMIAASCRLVASHEDIRSVHLAMHRRPAYPELLRIRTLADVHGLSMWVQGGGSVVLRSRDAESSISHDRDA